MTTKLRYKALEWFNSLSLEEQFYKVIKYNNLIKGDKTRHPNSLTGREIEIVYKANLKDNE